MVKIDHILKLYAETIQSPFLHYGYWDEPEDVDVTSLSISEVVDAQERYINNLSSFIPETVKTILDVGCGIGGNSAFLSNLGFTVDALSPDPYQKDVIKEKFNGTIPFHFTKFESFKTEKHYDLVLMSESAAYIKIRQGAEKAFQVLNPNGYWLASDYFVYTEDHLDNFNDADSLHLKSSHRLDEYLYEVKNAGFKLLEEIDITENVVPTLDAANYFYHRFVKPVAEYATVSIEKKHPRVLSFLKWIYGKRLDEKLKQLEYIKSDEFRKYRKYIIFLFQKV